jgi:hypothetical protein
LRRASLSREHSLKLVSRLYTDQPRNGRAVLFVTSLVVGIFEPKRFGCLIAPVVASAGCGYRKSHPGWRSCRDGPENVRRIISFPQADFTTLTGCDAWRDPLD